MRDKKIKIWRHAHPFDSAQTWWNAMRGDEPNSLETFDSWADAMSYVHRKWLGAPIPAAFFRQSQFGNKVL